MLAKDLRKKGGRTDPLEYHWRLRFEISVTFKPPAIASLVEFVGDTGI